LRLKSRGRELITTGVFNYFRHPLYAAFITFFDFGIAIYVNSWIFIIWAIIQHPIWHIIIRSEEKMMVEIFRDKYVEYCKITGRFFPRIIRTRNRKKYF
jgi:protein-S-isoprenylcysteine O-methyltransferase